MYKVVIVKNRIKSINKNVFYTIDVVSDAVDVISKDDGRFHVRIDVAVSKMFYGWIMGVSDKVRLVEPVCVVEQIQKFALGIDDKYKN